MAKLEELTKKLKFPVREKAQTVAQDLSPWEKTKRVIGGIFSWIYRLRGLLLVLPVAYLAVRLAGYNLEHLPQMVGVNLQASGEFAKTISRELAVYGPLGLTAACLLMTLCSRKVMYPLAISVFTLVLPLLLLFSNNYPC